MPPLFHKLPNQEFDCRLIVVRVMLSNGCSNMMKHTTTYGIWLEPPVQLNMIRIQAHGEELIGSFDTAILFADEAADCHPSGKADGGQKR